MQLNLHFTYICIRFYLSTINKIESARNYILFYKGPTQRRWPPLREF